MDFAYGPIETDNEPDGFGPLDLDEEEYEEAFEDGALGDELEDEDEDPYEYFVEPYEDEYEEEEFEDPGLGGFDDLKPFGSFDSGMGWDDPFL